MAKENFVLISGQVLFRPKIYMGRDGVPSKATMLLKAIRRHYVRSNLNSVNNGISFDIIPVVTFNPDCIKVCMNTAQHDMVELRGVYTTKENQKKSFCEKCGKEIDNPGVDTFVTPIYIRVTDKVRSAEHPEGYDPEKAIDILKERAEISNTVKIIGTLCREPEKIANVKQSSAQYQIASNRRFRIKEDNPSTKTDYPWVKTYGPQAESDFKALHVGSVIYIDGCFQSRQIKKRTICPSCGCENVVDDVAYEIVPYSVEYLANCTLPESNEDENS